MRTGYFPTFEGAGDFHARYVDALLLKGDALLAAGDAAAALAHFAECFEYPEGHQMYRESKFLPRDAQIWHAMARAYQAKGDAAKAAEFFQKAADADTFGDEFTYWKGLSLQALGRAGDLTLNALRNDILLIREVDGVLTHTKIDLRNSDILQSPYFFLQQNDVIIVQPSAVRVAAATTATGIWSVLLSSITTMIAVFRLF